MTAAGFSDKIIIARWPRLRVPMDHQRWNSTSYRIPHTEMWVELIERGCEGPAYHQSRRHPVDEQYHRLFFILLATK